MIAQIAREMGAYRHKLQYSPAGGSPVPKGVCGAALTGEETLAKRQAVKEVLTPFQQQMRRLNLRQSGEPRSAEPSPVPPKRVVKNLLAASASPTFEEARQEWDYSGKMLYEGDLGFSRECDLCGPKEQMRVNYLIYNPLTGKTLRVGSTCVRRFLVLAGTSSIEESAALFDRRTTLAAFGQTCKKWIGNLGRPEISEKSLVAVLGALEKAFPGGVSPDEAKVILRGAGLEGTRAEKIFTALIAKDTAVIRTLKIAKMPEKDPERRKMIIRTTLSRSGAYRDPAKKIV